MLQETFFFDVFEVNGLKRTLLKAGRRVPLNPKTFDLLFALVQHAGELVSKQDLLDLVWENQFVEEKNLTVHVAALRKAFGESKGEHRFIVTVPGHGYKFVAELRSPTEKDDRRENARTAGVRNNENGRERNLKQFRWLRTYGVGAGSLGVLIILIVVGGYFWQSRRKAGVLAAPSSQNLSIRRLTTDGKVNGAALAPDGKLFAYSHVDGEDQSLWLGHVDGGEAVQIRPPAPVTYSSFKFSPDGSSIFYTLVEENGRSGAVYKIPVFGGLPQKIEDKAYNISFSPDGKQFAFVRPDSAGSGQVLVISDADGKNEREVAKPPDKMNFAGLGSAWSPDGSGIAIACSRSESKTNYEIFTVDLADGSIKQLTNSAWSRVGTVAWLLDGSGLIVAGQKADSTHQQLWFVSNPGGEVRHLISDLNLYGSSITLGRDQNTLLTIQEQTQSNIWVAPAADLSLAKQITFGSIGRMDGWYGVAWTADGKLTYVVDNGENNTIWTMNADGSEQRQLIPFGGNNIYPSVTTDGRFIVFQSNRGGSFGVWRANRDGSDVLRLTDAGVAAQPDISPDGHWVVYVSSPENSGELWRITISGADPVKLADGAYWPRISPDSRYVACGYVVDGSTKLAVLSLDDGKPIQTFELPRLANLRLGVQWTPDGKALTYRDWANGIWIQYLDGGSPQRLKGLPAEKLYAFDWSPDGKYLAFTRGVETRDVVMISDFR